MSFSSSWSKGLDTPEQVAEMKANYTSAAPLREQLQLILEGKINEKAVWSENADRYVVTNWPYLMADSIGYIRALNEVIKLIEGPVSKTD